MIASTTLPVVTVPDSSTAVSTDADVSMETASVCACCANDGEASSEATSTIAMRISGPALKEFGVGTLCHHWRCDGQRRDQSGDRGGIELRTGISLQLGDREPVRMRRAVCA